jgi:HK97 family phage major capsid protein
MKFYQWLIGLLAIGLAAVTPAVPRTPQVLKFNENHFARRIYGKVIAGGGRIGRTVIALLRTAVATLCPRRLAIGAAVLGLLLILPESADMLALATGAVLVLPPDIAKKKAQHDQLATECLGIQDEYAGKEMPQNVGEDFQTKLQECESLWTEIEPVIKETEDRYEGEKRIRERKERLAALAEAGKTVADPTLPAEPEPENKSRIAGYVTLGQYVTMSEAFRKSADGGFRHPVQLGEIHMGIARAAKMGLTGPGGEPLVALSHDERKAFEAALDARAEETKSLVSIGAGVIEPQRLSVEPKVTADDRLRLRDVIPVGETSSASVSYIREESFTRSAAETTPGSVKPEGALSYTEQTATVRTIPAWIPVTTDQLADWPGLRSRIDNRLLYDIAKREEEELIYGDGTPPNIEGILDIAGTQDIAADADYTAGNDMLEKIRLGITLVAIAGYEANAILIHPRDWFTTVVLKGSDEHYLGQVFMTADRTPRVWSINVVETVAVEATAGVATEARELVVGDFIRGCELLDRMTANVMVGLNSDDFTRNRRTLLAEERIAFPIYAPAAFAHLETQASAT